MSYITGTKFGKSYQNTAANVKFLLLILIKSKIKQMIQFNEDETVCSANTNTSVPFFLGNFSHIIDYRASCSRRATYKRSVAASE